MSTLKERTMQLTLEILDLVEKMEYSFSKKVAANELARSVTSVGLNYIASRSVRNNKGIISKIYMIREEGVESIFLVGNHPKKGCNDAIYLLKAAN